MKYEVLTFGCKVNSYDSGLLEQKLLKTTLNPIERVVVLNTCAVTESAVKEAKQRALQIKMRNSETVVVVTGCGAQVSPEIFLPEADLVIGNSHKEQFQEILENFLAKRSSKKIHHGNVFKLDSFEGGGGIHSALTRSFLKIQDGCQSFCSYCIIPFARGKSRSLSVSQVTQEIQRLQDAGYLEVVLTGIHLADYSCPQTGANFETLLEQLLRNTTIPRLRISSLDPQQITRQFLDLAQDDRICRHFHISIQSANDSVLSSMKRWYSSTEVVESLLRLHNSLPQSFVAMDVIVGFPTESASQFENTYKTLSQLPWSKIHVFPYSERTGTSAQKTQPDSVSPAEKAERSRTLRELSSGRFMELAKSQMGLIKKGLKLNMSKNKGLQSARFLARDYWTLETAPTHLVGEVCLRVTGLAQARGTLGECHLAAEVVL